MTPAQHSHPRAQCRPMPPYATLVTRLQHMHMLDQSPTSETPYVLNTSQNSHDGASGHHRTMDALGWNMYPRSACAGMQLPKNCDSSAALAQCAQKRVNAYMCHGSRAWEHIGSLAGECIECMCKCMGDMGVLAGSTHWRE